MCVYVVLYVSCESYYLYIFNRIVQSLSILYIISKKLITFMCVTGMCGSQRTGRRIGSLFLPHWFGDQT